jgi:hypothetical protein
MGVQSTLHCSFTESRLGFDHAHCSQETQLEACSTAAGKLFKSASYKGFAESTVSTRR